MQTSSKERELGFLDIYLGSPDFFVFAGDEQGCHTHELQLAPEHGFEGEKAIHDVYREIERLRH